MITPRSLADLAKNPPTKPPCYIDGLLPSGKMILVGGCKGVGKSWLVMEMVRALATGTPLFGASHFTVPAPVRPWLLDRELGPWTLAERWRQFDPDAQLNDALFHCAHDLRLDNDAGVDEMIESLCAARANVLIVDCVNRFIGGNLNDNGYVVECLNRLDAMTRAVPDLSVVLVHHFKKPSKDSDHLDIYNFSGAANFVNITDSQVAVYRPGGYTVQKDANGLTYWRVTCRVLTRHSAAPDGDLPLEIKPGTVLPVKLVAQATRKRSL